MSINRVSISGNLTRDAELRSTAGGTSVLQFSVAVNERRKNSQTGEWEDYPNYIDCTLFGKRAEALQQRLSKIRLIMWILFLRSFSVRLPQISMFLFL